MKAHSLLHSYLSHQSFPYPRGPYRAAQVQVPVSNDFRRRSRCGDPWRHAGQQRQLIGNLAGVTHRRVRLRSTAPWCCCSIGSGAPLLGRVGHELGHNCGRNPLSSDNAISPGMSRERGREHTRNALRGSGVRHLFGTHARWGLGPPPRLTSPSPRGRVGQGLTRTRGHATPRSGPLRGAWKLVEAPLTGGEARGRDKISATVDIPWGLRSETWKSGDKSPLMYWAISVQAGLNPGTIFLFQWKGAPWSVAGATRTPHQGPWPAGPRPPHDSLYLGRDCARLASCFWRYRSVCFGVVVRTRINQRCVCFSSVVLVRCVPCDPGVCVLSPLCRSAYCAEFTDGAVPRQLCGQKPLQ